MSYANQEEVYQVTDSMLKGGTYKRIEQKHLALNMPQRCCVRRMINVITYIIGICK